MKFFFFFLKTGTTFANLKLEETFPVLKNWLKMSAKTSKVGSGNSRKSLEGIANQKVFGLYSINYSFDFLSSDRGIRKGISYIFLSKYR